MDCLRTVFGFSRVFILIIGLNIFGYWSVYKVCAYNYYVGAMGLIFL